MDSPPCLKVTHKTFGTQNSNADMIYCRLSMPVECHSSFSHSLCLDSEAFQKRKQMQEILSHTTTQCYYAIRIFAGQDPSCVWVGWVTPDYHLYSEKFDLNKNCTVTVTLGDERGRVHESVKRSNCYMVWGGDIVASSQRSNRSNVDLEIGCLVDLAMGMLSFSANGKELGTCYQPQVTASRLKSLLAASSLACGWRDGHRLQCMTPSAPPPLPGRKWNRRHLAHLLQQLGPNQPFPERSQTRGLPAGPDEAGVKNDGAAHVPHVSGLCEEQAHHIVE
ncbi:Ryanodine receptor 3 [Saguinus oedipus]|uniref:Ryanodine receptor 3 n=1 Tax=Saguinus oedipus TaxID=9490 RepID=A0ABQ9V3A3_SAGOE|nr:Ryanodine receptor 3 [Saguinus oedipus]